MSTNQTKTAHDSNKGGMRQDGRRHQPFSETVERGTSATKKNTKQNQQEDQKPFMFTPNSSHNSIAYKNLQAKTEAKNSFSFFPTFHFDLWVHFDLLAWRLNHPTAFDKVLDVDKVQVPWFLFSWPWLWNTTWFTQRQRYRYVQTNKSDVKGQASSVKRQAMDSQQIGTQNTSVLVWKRTLTNANRSLLIFFCFVFGNFWLHRTRNINFTPLGKLWLHPFSMSETLLILEENWF